MARDTDVAIVELATTQHGVFSVAQARSRDISLTQLSDRLKAGILSRPFLGVYRLAGLPLSFESDLMAACLAGGRSTSGSHRSAATLWNVAGGRRDVCE